MSARGRIAYVALSLGGVAVPFLVTAAQPLAAGFIGVCLVVIATGAIWDLGVLLVLATDALRRRSGRRPFCVGIAYGAGEDTWFETTPATEPYRSCDAQRLVARGEPVAAARHVGGALATRLGVTIVVCAVPMAIRGADPHDGCPVSRAKTACNTIRSATMQWKAVNPGILCPTVEMLKADRDLDPGFNLRDPWGGPYDVYCVDDAVTCASAGPDRWQGTDDDIVVPMIEVDAVAPGNALGR